ncbi:MAG: biotin/lipoate A/B protein ligase family protein [Oscillospiraceae bacterium]
MIQLACRSFGIEAVRSGRNDILAEGRKFSGNAFYQSGGRSYHHGTLLVDVDMTRMSRYLNPSKAKLEAKGVDSVRSRVVNLKELAPEITIDQLKVQLAAAFQEVYHLPCKHIAPEELDRDQVEGSVPAHIAAGIGDLESSFPSPSAVRTSSPGAESRCSPGRRRNGPGSPGVLRRHGLGNRTGTGTGPCRLPICPARPSAMPSGAVARTRQKPSARC